MIHPQSIVTKNKYLQGYAVNLYWYHFFVQKVEMSTFEVDLEASHVFCVPLAKFGRSRRVVFLFFFAIIFVSLRAQDLPGERYLRIG